jgi:hypothetical protein
MGVLDQEIGLVQNQAYGADLLAVFVNGYPRAATAQTPTEPCCREGNPQQDQLVATRGSRGASAIHRTNCPH